MRRYILFLFLFIILLPMAASSQSKEKLFEELLELKQMDIFYQMGIDAYLKGKPHEALFYFEKGLELGKKIEDPKLRTLKSFSTSYLLKSIKDVYVMLGQFEKAITTLENGVELMREFDNPLIEADLYSDIGSLYEFQGMLSKALFSYERAFNISKAHELKDMESISLLRMGNIHLELDHFDKALNLYKEAGKNREGIFDDLNDFILMSSIVKVHFLKGQYDESLDYLEKVLKNIKVPFFRVLLLSIIGDNYIQLGDMNKAYSYFEEALKTISTNDFDDSLKLLFPEEIFNPEEFELIKELLKPALEGLILYKMGYVKGTSKNQPKWLLHSYELLKRSKSQHHETKNVV